MRTLAISLAFVTSVASASAEPSRYQPTIPQIGPVFMPVRSFVDLRFKGVVRQTTDISCGAAALATLLTYYFDQKVSEEDVIRDILESASPEQKSNIERYGYSLLELKQAGERFGLFGGGFRLNGTESLAKLKAPVIALTNVRGYAHFVVIRGARDGKVFIADPAFGNRTQTFKAFAEEWDQVVLTLIRINDGRAITSFMDDHALYARADTLVPLWSAHRDVKLAAPTEF
jgi:predicted double-glycine peptidase